MDCRQITYVTLYGFCPLSKPPPSHPPLLFLTDNIMYIDWDGYWIVYQTKSNKKYMPFLHYISSFESTSLKICKTEPPDLFLLLFLLAFTSANITFHKFLELYSTLLSEKKIWFTNFPFLTDSLTPSPFPPVT